MSAVSKITGNSKLKLLEQTHGEVKRPYKSFYVPKEKEANVKFAVNKVANFLQYSGINSEVSKDLFRLKKVQVDKKGSIWLFPEHGNKGAIEVSPTAKGGFKKKSHGVFDSLFATSNSSGRKVTVYTDPFSYMKAKGKSGFDNNKRSSDIVMMGLDESGIDKFLTKNRHVSSLNFVIPEDSKQNRDVLSFVSRVSKKYQKHSISVSTVTFDSVEHKHRRSAELEL